MSFEIKPATRAGVKLLVGLYGKSGSGKTMSALLLARGIAGPSGKIVLIDSENGRGSIFADLVPGGYDVLNLDEPFTPDNYANALAAADKVADVICQDSYSHEWAGPGGVLEMQEAELQRMAGDDFKRREACKMASWISPKRQHKALVNRLLRCRAAMIVCLRGEEKTHMEKKEGEKTRVITDLFSSPIADPRFIFELLLNFETIAKVNERSGKVEGGFAIPRKVTHPAMLPLLPGENEQLSIKHGEALAAWCRGQAAPAPASADPKKKLLSEIRDATVSVHGWTKTQPPAAWDACKLKLSAWLVDELGIDTLLSAQSEEELRETLRKVNAKLGGGALL